ncbi:MAG: ATP-binding cassette domain-containing protein, partial [Lachnospiraceae bacterium]|nr:ATP-binding cassette domain-containing protein [Lachnospiraceae bacterium]
VKSTLIMVISGLFRQTKGTVENQVVMAPIIELVSGFDMQYTGAENIFLYGAVLGHSRKFMKEKYDEIVEFSELSEFIDVPLKNYSSGMRARLGFAIATAVSPDILILDEVLSVGDAKFKKKSEKKIRDMMDKGITVLFVSHNMEQIRRICNKAVILERGSLIKYGDMEETVSVYESMTK